MAIYDYLPKYYQIEANNLKGLQPGFVVAQLPVVTGEDFLQEKFNKKGSSSTSATKMIANGHIVSVSGNGIVDAEMGAPLFIVFNEPLKTLFDAEAFYATNLDEEHLRCVQLIPGDEWMSDMELDLTSHVVETVETNPLYGRIVKIDASTNTNVYGSDDWFSVTTLADGTPAYHYMFVK